MLGYLYELFMSFVTLVLGFFGIDLKKKSVSFADEVEKKDEVQTEEPAKEETAVAESA
jgi:hypothetical protein